MYLIVLNYDSGNIDIIRDVPEDIENLEDFVVDVLGYHLTDVEYMLTSEDNVFNIVDYDEEDNTLIDKGFDYVGSKW